MRKGMVVLSLVLMVMLSLGCISEESQVQTTEQPETTLPPVETTITPAPTIPTTTTPAPVITTIPPTTVPPETLGPVSDYLLKKGLYNLDVSPLEEDGSLDENDKALIDLLASTKIKTSWRETPYPSIIGDGIVRDEELTYVKLRIKVSEEIGSDYVKVVDNLLDKNPSLIGKLSEVWDKDPETATNAIKLSQIEYIEKAFEYGLEDIAFTPEYIGDLEKLEEYHKYLEIKNKINTESELFPVFSKETQEFIINTPWIQEGVDPSDIAYIDLLPSDFNVLDKTKNTDGGGKLGYVEDWIEVFLKKNVYNDSDDEGFLTWPLYCEDPQTITAFFDLEPSICPGGDPNDADTPAARCDPGRRDWKGGKHTFDSHAGVDINIPERTPILAMTPTGIISDINTENPVIFRGTLRHGDVTMQYFFKDVTIKHHHLTPIEEGGIVVEKEAKVNRFDEIALSGNTGKSGGPHIHVTYKKHYIKKDPFRDTMSSESKSKFINDNIPLCIYKNGNLDFASLIVGDYKGDYKGNYAKD